jgi:hypothetical protein
MFCNVDVDSKYDEIREISTDEEEVQFFFIALWDIQGIRFRLDKDKNMRHGR